MTFLEMQARMIHKLSESANPQYWTLDEIKANLNLAYRKFIAATEFKTKTAFLELVAPGYYKIPSDLMIAKKVYYGGKPLDQITRETIDQQLDGYASNNVGVVGDMNSVARPRHAWLFDDGYIRVFPAPEEENTPTYSFQQSGTVAGGVNTIALSSAVVASESDSLLFIGGVLQSPGTWAFDPSGMSITLDDLTGGPAPWVLVGLPSAGTTSSLLSLRYVPKPIDMIGNSDAPSWIPSAHHDALCDYALYECLSREGDGQNMQKAVFYLNRFDRSILEFNNAFNRQVIPDRALPFVV